MAEIAQPVSRSYGAGDDISLDITVLDAAGDPVDISGLTVRFAVVPQDGSAAVLSSEDAPVTATPTIPTGTDGVINIAVAGEDTVDLEGTYEFECEIEDGSGVVSTVARGYFTFVPSLFTYT